jgi:hypothetical protein
MTDPRPLPPWLLPPAAAQIVNDHHRGSGNEAADWVMGLLVAADVVEEHGDGLRADGLRWLAEVPGRKGQQPFRYEYGESYGWFCNNGAKVLSTQTWDKWVGSVNDKYQNYVPPPFDVWGGENSVDCHNDHVFRCPDPAAAVAHVLNLWAEFTEAERRGLWALREGVTCPS